MCACVCVRARVCVWVRLCVCMCSLGCAYACLSTCFSVAELVGNVSVQRSVMHGEVSICFRFCICPFPPHSISPRVCSGPPQNAKTALFKLHMNGVTHGNLSLDTVYIQHNGLVCVCGWVGVCVGMGANRRGGCVCARALHGMQHVSVGVREAWPPLSSTPGLVACLVMYLPNVEGTDRRAFPPPPPLLLLPAVPSHRSRWAIFAWETCTSTSIP